MSTPRRIEYMPLGQIARAPRNPKKHDSQAIAASVDQFGLAEVPCLDERTGRLVAGHGRLDDLTARQSTGQPAPDGVTLAEDGTWLVPVIRGWASQNDDHAAAYLLASNRVAERGGWHQDSLDELLADLARADLDLAEAAGWDMRDLEALLETAATAEAETEGEHIHPVSPPIVHDTVPATGASYAETPEQLAARSELVASYTKRVATGTVEVILVYTLEERDEVTRHVNAVRGVLGADLRASEVVLRALRALEVALSAPGTPDAVLEAAGWTVRTAPEPAEVPA